MFWGWDVLNDGSVVIDDVAYAFIPNPKIGDYKPVRLTPKVTFISDAGYRQQREAAPYSRMRIPLEWTRLTDAERNMLMAWIEYIKSETFLFVLPLTLRPRPSGEIIPEFILARIIDEEIPDEPSTSSGLWHVKITLEQV
jgi:hypothetical protein